MNLTTKYSIGQTVWAASTSFPVGPLTIGQVQKTITDSPGLSREIVFDNYKPQQRTEEKYMCVETGIGTGACYHVQDLFLTEQEAIAQLQTRALARARARALTPMPTLTPIPTSPREQS